MNNTSKILRNTAAAVLVAVTCANLYLIGTSVYNTVAVLAGGTLSQSLISINILTLLKSILDPMLCNVFNLVLSAVLAVRILKNKNETAAVRIFCFGNAAYNLYLFIVSGLGNPTVYINDFGSTLLILAQIILPSAIAVMYRKTCEKQCALWLSVMSAALVAVTCLTYVAAIYRLNAYAYLTPYNFVYMFVLPLIIYLPLLLLCINKRIDNEKEDSSI